MFLSFVIQVIYIYICTFTYINIYIHHSPETPTDFREIIICNHTFFWKTLQLARPSIRDLMIGAPEVLLQLCHLPQDIPKKVKLHRVKMFP